MRLALPDSIFANLPQAWLVGGAVRDMVRGAEPLDYDVVVPARPHRLARILAGRLHGKVITLGKDRFSVHRVVSKGLDIDVTTVKGGEIKSDLLARDFTINALACDLANGEVIDPLGALTDIADRRVKMVSAQAFNDDPARLIRAFRMAASMHFNIETRTLSAISRQAGAIEQVAGERIWAELELIMASAQSLPVLSDMAQSQLLYHVIPELRALVGCDQNQHHTTDVFNHTLQAYGAMENQLTHPAQTHTHEASTLILAMPRRLQVLIKLAVLLHDVGKPISRSVDGEGKMHFYSHANKGAALSRAICQRLRMSSRDQQWIELIIRHHQRPLSLYLSQQKQALAPRAVGRFFRQCAQETPCVLIHAIADHLGKRHPPHRPDDDPIHFYKELLSNYLGAISQPVRTPLIDGNDLIKIFGITPSPLVGQILRSIEELQLAGILSERHQALEWVSEYVELNRS